MFRELNPGFITATAERLTQRIIERFPQAALREIARQLSMIAEETELRIASLRRPIWWLRLGAWGLIAALGLAVIVLPISLNVRREVSDLSDLMQGIEAAVNNVVFIAIAAWFLATMEGRRKRKTALAALHELRSVAHIIDMHQLTKDPDMVLYPERDTASSPERLMNRFELGRYLDYCSEMLSITSKLAALYLEHLDDPQVLHAVNDVQQLAEGLSSKIWQKIMILDTATAQ